MTMCSMSGYVLTVVLVCSMWRKASIIADATLEICLSGVNGQALIDEDFLRTRGVTDFVKYRCDPNVEVRV